MMNRAISFRSKSPSDEFSDEEAKTSGLKSSPLSSEAGKLREVIATRTVRSVDTSAKNT
jgi:hypothetical protein